MEEWDIYDKNLIKIGKTCIRGKQDLQDGEYHLVVHIWIFTKEGKILLTQRSEKKEKDPLKWESTGGSVVKGENPIDAAIRETEEEIGLTFSAEEFKLFRKEIREHFHDCFFAYYVIAKEDIIDKIKFTDGEVIDKKWVTMNEYNKMFENGESLDNLLYIKEDYKKIFAK